MAYIEVHLSILHPNLSDFTGTRQVDRRIFANAYTAFGEVSKWAIGAHIASSEKAAPGRVRAVLSNFVPKPRLASALTIVTPYL